MCSSSNETAPAQLPSAVSALERQPYAGHSTFGLQGLAGCAPCMKPYPELSRPIISCLFKSAEGPLINVSRPGKVCGSPPQPEMEGFSLEAPIVKQLQHILRSYPGGQLLSEALQNAEDSCSETFVLMLDERTHAVEPCLNGPAFVLMDDGRGFSDLDWSSMKSLNDSQKRKSPRDIGRFGMGSRSFFHYADVMTISSNGTYVGIDPLKLINTHGRGLAAGWKASLSATEGGADAAALAAEAEQLMVFPAGVLHSDRGAKIRLPLRQKRLGDDDVNEDGDHEEDRLGPILSTAQAQKMLQQWCHSYSRALLP